MLSVFIFRSRYFEDRWADDLHQIFQEGGKWIRIEKLSFWFLNSFRGETDVQKGNFFQRFQLEQDLRNRTCRQKESCLILAGYFLYKRCKRMENPSADGRDHFVHVLEFSTPEHCLIEKGWICFFRFVALLHNKALMKTSVTAMV